MRTTLYIVLAIVFSITFAVFLLYSKEEARGIEETRGTAETTVKSVLGIPADPLTREQLDVLASRNFSFFVGDMTQHNGTETFHNAENLESVAHKTAYLYYALPLQPSHYDFIRGASLFDPYLFQRASGEESLFLHSTGPAGITMRIDRLRNALTLYWLKDQRADRYKNSVLSGYDLYETDLVASGDIDHGRIRKVNSSPLQGNSTTLPFVAGKHYFVWTLFKPATASSYPGLRPTQNDLLYNIDFTRFDPPPSAGTRVMFNASIQADPSLSQVSLLFDQNKNRRFDDNERFPMQRAAGTNRWSVTLPLIQAGAGSLDANLGWAFAFEGAGQSGTRVRMPTASSEAFTTNINNRVRLTANGAYLSTLATDVSRRQVFQDDLTKLLAAYLGNARAFRGIFFDIVPPAAFEGGEWSVADPAPYGSAQISSFITKIKNAFPGLTVFAGASRTFSSSESATQGAWDSLGLVNGPYNLAIDGFMYEKTGVQGRPTHVSSGSYTRQMNAAIKASQGGSQVVLKTAVRNHADPAETPLSPGQLGRRYGALANYLIARGDTTFLWYDGWPLYYPEFDLDLGKPLDTKPTIEGYRASGGLYARKFEKGLVVYNPGDGIDSYTLSDAEFAALRQLIIAPCIVADACPLNASVASLANGNDVGRLTLRRLGQQTLKVPPRFALILVQPPADTAASSPQVSLTTIPVTSATGLSTFSGTFSVSANVSDAKDLAGVQLLVDGRPFGKELYEPPYLFKLNTKLLSDGTHTISVSARTVDGTVGRAKDLFIGTKNNDLVAPKVTLVAPAPQGALTGIAEFGATASDENVVADVRFLVDGKQIGQPITEEPYNFRFDTAALADGSHALVVEGRDANGNVGRSPAVEFTTANHDTTAPGVNVTAPAFNAELSGRITLRAEASDNTGVTSVQFLLDGRPFGGELGTAPYTLSLNSRFFANGPHKVGAVAKDFGGNVGRAAEIPVVSKNDASGIAFSRDLKLGSSGEDVRLLQEFLNVFGFAVATSGAGSPGNETTTFGPATQRALAKFQEARSISPAAGYLGPLTRVLINKELGLGQ